MGKYYTYAEKLDILARQRFSDYEKASSAFKKAQMIKQQLPMKSGIGVTVDYQLKAKKAEIEYIEAEKVFKEAKENYQNTLREAGDIRAELLEAVSRDISIDPDDLDRNTVDLLKSGICSPEEIAELYDKAKSVTTKRYIAKYASEAVKNLDNNMEQGKYLRATTILNNVAHAGKAYADPNNSPTMQMFDSVNGVLKRCINNPSMISHWAELTEETLSEL